jgi:hypothetical protein
MRRLLLRMEGRYEGWSFPECVRCYDVPKLLPSGIGCGAVSVPYPITVHSNLPTIFSFARLEKPLS